MKNATIYLVAYSTGYYFGGLASRGWGNWATTIIIFLIWEGMIYLARNIYQIKI